MLVTNEIKPTVDIGFLIKSDFNMWALCNENA